MKKTLKLILVLLILACLPSCKKESHYVTTVTIPESPNVNLIGYICTSKPLAGEISLSYGIIGKVRKSENSPHIHAIDFKTEIERVWLMEEFEHFKTFPTVGDSICEKYVITTVIK